MTAAIVPQDFYVYTHHKATTGEIFYVGKGQGRRAWDAAKNKRTAWWHSVARKHGVRVEIAQDGLQEWAAFELEQELIALHGRQDQNNGPLVNLSDGGEGASGATVTPELAIRRGKGISQAWQEKYARGYVSSWKGRQHSQKTKEKISRIKKSTPVSEKFKAQIGRGFKPEEMHTPAGRAKLSATLKRKYATGEAAPHNEQAVVMDSTGQKFKSLQDAIRHLKANGYPKATHSGIRVRLTGERPSPIYGSTWSLPPPM